MNTYWNNVMWFGKLLRDHAFLQTTNTSYQHQSDWLRCNAVLERHNTTEKLKGHILQRIRVPITTRCQEAIERTDRGFARVTHVHDAGAVRRYHWRHKRLHSNYVNFPATSNRRTEASIQVSVIRGSRERGRVWAEVVVLNVLVSGSAISGPRRCTS